MYLVLTSSAFASAAVEAVAAAAVPEVSKKWSKDMEVRMIIFVRPFMLKRIELRFFVLTVERVENEKDCVSWANEDDHESKDNIKLRIHINIT